ncbi:hypothetical protein QCA50_001619 [Cerrena zonata]|uniref:Copper acquisition factor BIM1-like domain-containing protein n=1 Tax=Cerrena zonata TaxID=2478898 RepID=A0AAW0GM76_9APHY
MRFTSLAFFSGLLTVASAHFALQYPEPRGIRVADDEVNFCDGYPTAASNRSQFPLSGGFVSIESHHQGYTVGVIVSTAQNPSSFDNFTTAVDYFTYEQTGTLCFPINLNATGVSGIKDGANVTIQIVYNGGDGNLYQCADLTLNSTLTSVTNATCANATDTATSTSTSASATASTTNNSAQTFSGFSLAALLSVAGVAMSLL